MIVPGKYFIEYFYKFGNGGPIVKKSYFLAFEEFNELIFMGILTYFFVSSIINILFFTELENSRITKTGH